MLCATANARSLETSGAASNGEGRLGVRAPSAHHGRRVQVGPREPSSVERKTNGCAVAVSVQSTRRGQVDSRVDGRGGRGVVGEEGRTVSRLPSSCDFEEGWSARGVRRSGEWVSPCRLGAEPVSAVRPAVLPHPPTTCHRVPAAGEPGVPQTPAHAGPEFPWQPLGVLPSLARPPSPRAPAGAWTPAVRLGSGVRSGPHLRSGPARPRAGRFSELRLPRLHVGRIPGLWVCPAPGTMRPGALWVRFRRVLVPGPARPSPGLGVIGHPLPSEHMAFRVCLRKCFPQCPCEARGHLRAHAGGLAAAAFPDHQSHHVLHLCRPTPLGHSWKDGLPARPLPCSSSAPLLGLLKFVASATWRSVEAHGNTPSVWWCTRGHHTQAHVPTAVSKYPLACEHRLLVA